MAYGIFRAYGLFWERDEVDWAPGAGNRRTFRLLGRIGTNRPGLRLADFRFQHGIYILYGDAGPHYVGLTREQTLGKRLRDHLFDPHEKHWSRFSWFSFSSVLKKTDGHGLQKFGARAAVTLNDPNKVMGDVEALLIRAMALTNVAQMNFAHADEWTQIALDEYDMFLEKVRPAKAR